MARRRGAIRGSRDERRGSFGRSVQIGDIEIGKRLLGQAQDGRRGRREMGQVDVAPDGDDGRRSGTVDGDGDRGPVLLDGVVGAPHGAGLGPLPLIKDYGDARPDGRGAGHHLPVVFTLGQGEASFSPGDKNRDRLVTVVLTALNQVGL